MAEQATPELAGLLQQLRAEAQLTQQELAKAAGVSSRSVSDLERGINRTAVSWRAVRLMPRSRSLTARGLTPAALASSCWVNRASARSCRSSPAHSEVACSAMTAASPPTALSPPAAPSTARKGLMP